MSLARTPSFSESSLTVTPSERKTGPVGSGFLNSRSLPESCARVSLAARRRADLETGFGAGASSVSALFSIRRQRDVGIGVFLVSAHELPQIDLVGDRDLRLRSPLLGGLLGLLLLLFLALGRGRRAPARPAARRRGRREGRRAGRAGDRRVGSADRAAAVRPPRDERPGRRAPDDRRTGRARSGDGIPSRGPPRPCGAGGGGGVDGRAGACPAGAPAEGRCGGTGRGGRMILRGRGFGASGSGSDGTTAVRAGSAGLVLDSAAVFVSGAVAAFAAGRPRRSPAPPRPEPWRERSASPRS